MICFSECPLARLFVTEGPKITDVVGDFVMNQRRTIFGCCTSIYHGGQLFIFDLDQIERIISNVGGFGYHRHHPITHMTDFINREWPMNRGFEIWHVPPTRKRTHTAVNQILPNINSDHPIQFFSCIGVNAVNLCMSIWTTQNSYMSHARHLNIGYVFALPLNKTRVFTSLNASTYILTHSYTPFITSAALKTASTML